MEKFKKVIDNLLIVTVEEVMLQTGLEKYDAIKLCKVLGYEIEGNQIIIK